MCIRKVIRHSHTPVVPIANTYCTGYPHNCLADNATYRHDCCADKRRCHPHAFVRIASAGKTASIDRVGMTPSVLYKVNYLLLIAVTNLPNIYKTENMKIKLKFS